MLKKAQFAALAVLVSFFSVLCLPALAGAPRIEDAANAFKSGKHVFVAGDAESNISEGDARSLEDQIGRSGAPIYIAVLADAAKSEVNNNADSIPGEIGKQLGKPAVVGAVAGKSFRAGSGGNVTNFSSGEAGKLANDAFNENNPGKSGGNVTPMLKSFVDKSAREYSSKSGSSGSQSSGASTSAASSSSSQGSSFPWLTVLFFVFGLIIALIIAVICVAISRSKRAREDEIAESEIRLSSLSDDLYKAEENANLNHPDVKPIIDNAWSCYNAAKNAHDKGQYGMAESKTSEAERYLREARSAMAPEREEPTPRTRTVRGGKAEDLDASYVDFDDPEVDPEVRRSYERVPQSQRPTQIVNVTNTYQQGRSYGSGYQYHPGCYPGYGYGYYPGYGGYGYYGYNGDFVSGMLMADMMNDRRERDVDRLEDRVDRIEHIDREVGYSHASNGGDWDTSSSSRSSGSQDFSDSPNGGDWGSSSDSGTSYEAPSYSAPEPSSSGGDWGGSSDSGSSGGDSGGGGGGDW